MPGEPHRDGPDRPESDGRFLELGRRTGTPVYVLKDGEIVDLTANDPSRGPKT